MIVLDIEATGTSPHLHSIVSIGALEFEHPENQFYIECQIWEGAHVMDEAMEVNGFTREQIVDKTKVTDKEAVEQFIEWLGRVGEHTTAGQNPSFDRDFIYETCLRNHLNYPLAHRTIDVHSVAYAHMVWKGLVPPVDPQHRRSALNSTAIQNYVGIPEEPKPHNALNGAKVAAEALSRLLYKKPLLGEFQEFEIPLGLR